MEQTMNNKQSSVEWLISQLKARHREGNPNSCAIENYFAAKADLIEQAKAMHKDEIKEALIDGAINSTFIEYRIPHYYNETFGGNK